MLLNNMRKFCFCIISFFFINSIFAQEKLDIYDIARKGTIDQVESIFKENPEIINTNNEHGFSPLILACYNGNEAVATFLIEKANIDYVSNEGTALMAAVVKENTRLVNLLLEKKVNPNLTNKQGTTALIYAVQFKNLEIIRLLLKFKASKTQIDKQGKTAFEYAVFSNNEDVINLLK
jgi:ankyrin repeat protein